MSLGLILMTAATILLLLAIVGFSGILHLAIWVLVIVLLFGLAFLGIALVMRLLGG
jgi:hypothetical protein